VSSDANPLRALALTFGVMSPFAVEGANSTVPEMHRVAVDVQHRMTDQQFADAFWMLLDGGFLGFAGIIG